MNSILSGTGWGELAEPELEIPYWMTKEYREADRRIRDAYEANIAAAVGRERRRIRAARQQETASKKNWRKGLALVLFPALVLMLAAKIVEVVL